MMTARFLKNAFLLFSFQFATLSLPAQTPGDAVLRYPFRDTRLSIEKRIDNLLSLLSLQEKINCLGTNPSVPRLGVRGAGHVEGLHGLAMGIPGAWGGKDPVPTTIFPQAIGLAETWNPALLTLVADIEAEEVRYLFQSAKYRKGGLVVRAPNADLGRDPRWGRTEECYGEDPFLAGTMAVAFIKGLQGPGPRYWKTAALMKHFLANSNEKGRDSSSSDFDQRLFREYYSVPFRMGIQAGGSRAFMSSYNKVNGIPQSVSPLLKNVAIREWGQNGIICTDGGAYKMLVTAHKYFKTYEEAAAACVKAGINQFLDDYQEGIKGALERKLLTESDLDDALRGVFRVMIKLGQLDDAEEVPYSKIRDTTEPWMSRKHREAVRLVTGQSIVLLKNRGQLLPLNKEKIRSIAVVGPRSSEVYQDWYSGTPAYSVSPIQGIRDKLGSGIFVSHTTDNDLAVSLAKSADFAIVCIGNHPTGNAGWARVSNRSEGKEAVDREDIRLDSAQEELIQRVYQANPNTVLVLISSFPYAINWADENIPAIVHLSHNSQELGAALADALFGDINPAGRLVQTWPRSVEQLPAMMDYDIRKGRTYMYFQGKPLYPFGYGLSYTSFHYSDLKTVPGALRSASDSLSVSVKVSNTGSRPGDEVVQLYITHIKSAVRRPQKELKAFRRISLRPGETKTVQLTVKAEDLRYWNVKEQRFVLEKDWINLQVGSSSADIRLGKSLKIK